MTKQELEEFIEYHTRLRLDTAIDTIDHLYEHFGCEFIFGLPVVCTTYRSGNKYIVIQGTAWVHSTTEPAYCGVDNQYRFYMLGYRLSLDEWLLYSALSPEEQIMFKLKYG